MKSKPHEYNKFPSVDPSGVVSSDPHDTEKILGGETYEWIKPFPEGVKLGHSALYYGKKADKYYLLEKGTGSKVSLSLDSARLPQIRINTFCTPPAFSKGKIYISAEVDGEACRLMIDLACQNNCRLQPATA